MPDLHDPATAATRILTIDHLGAQGDGRARAAGAWVSVPFTLPGERVHVSGDGDRLALHEVIDASPDRAPPLCRHFGACGGCTLQHLAPAPYAAFKRDLIVRALAARGIAASVAETWITPPASRRRATFAAQRSGKRILLGFHARKRHALISLRECPVIRAPLVAALPVLEAIAGELLSGEAAVNLSLTDTPAGLDLHVARLAPEVSARARAEAASIGLRAGFARVTIDGDAALTERRPCLPVGGAQLWPPPGGFLQASAEAEAEMARIIGAHLAGARHIADLFAGCGTFALRLAAQASVHAAEGDRAAIDALAQSARAAPGLKPVTTEQRDLFRNPLGAAELARFDALVLDPPRAGAAAQVAGIANARLPRLAYVSCNPATLARDVRVLVDGGYRIVRVHPIDQFLWSAHVEAVALLEGPAA